MVFMGPFQLEIFHGSVLGSPLAQPREKKLQAQTSSFFTVCFFCSESFQLDSYSGLGKNAYTTQNASFLLCSSSKLDGTSSLNILDKNGHISLNICNSKQ